MIMPGFSSAWEGITMKVSDFHSMDGHAARESGRLNMMEVYCEK